MPYKRIVSISICDSNSICVIETISNMYVCNSKIIHFIFIKSHFTAHDCIIINVFLENKVVRISIIVLFGAKALNGTN